VGRRRPAPNVPDPDGWPADLLSLLESGRLDDLRLGWDGLSGREMEDLAVRAIPAEDLTYASPYCRPRKIWGIGLNYDEHAGDLDEAAPAEEPASFMRPDTTIIGPETRCVRPKTSGG
jgi:2-keto-4-pentenoate hydratase/2-oxohepta-3-ene-1,7-dioic acid hydratase in catechol pathway